MLVPGSANAMLLAANAQYQISRSVRVRASATAYLARTFNTPTNEKIWTWSAWVKRGALGSNSTMFSASTGASPAYDGFRFNTSDQLQFFAAGAVTVSLVTTAVFRDPSAWYHIVLSYNATTTTVTIYVNGVAQTTTGTTVSNTTYSFNHASTPHYIGGQVLNNAPSAGVYFDGYMTEINFIDGQALTASSFGNNNAVTGVWQPKKYTGTYGTNGYYLNFSDNSSNTATTIGKDYSGNGNNWTPNNISVTTGVTYDSMIDTPTPYTDGSTYYNRGNYGVINPNNSGGMVMSAGNLLATPPGASWTTALGTMAIPSGTYWEYTISVVGSIGNHQPGVASSAATLSNYCGFDANGWAISTAAGTVYRGWNNNTSTANISGVPTTAMAIGDVWMFAFKNNKFYWGLNGTWYPTGANPATETSPIYSSLPNEVFAGASSYGSAAAYFNFGQQPFKYTPPSGFKALNTFNMTAPTISNGARYMAATLYTGNGSTQTVTNTVNNVSFQPDLVWVKSRSSIYYASLTDSVRGVDKYLYSGLTIAEETQTTALSSFNSNGFSLAGAFGNVNANGTTYVGWQWLAGAGTTSSDTSGSITSTVSVNATAGFSVVTFTAQASGTGTVGHGLGVAPSFIITKQRATAGTAWTTYHTSVGNTAYLVLNTTAASATLSTVWNNTSPTSSVFTLGSAFAAASTMVAYCFAAVKGYSAFGSYTGNGNANGPFIYTGFSPRWIMIKSSSAISAWLVIDTSRQAYNVQGPYLLANTADAETTGTTVFDILSNGFKMRSATTLNTNAATYIYAAFAENPFNNSLAR